MIRKTLFATLILFILPFAVAAVEPDEILDDPVLEARARDISQDLRCVVCQNENIDSSNAGVARDLRLLVRERLIAGDTNQQALDFIQARYGDYVLLKPPFQPSTYALWLAPGVFLLFGIGVCILVLSRARTRRPNEALSDSEESAVAELLAQENRSDP
ncbi:cytochrome c-type biogenesis protein [Roseovarius sp. M141]|uniref:cytochrome c-type biogenesis protein n=1 Tax=Pelagivirga sediminicola TaxID=2170575 RepID=UPI00268D5F7C|nr:cytochrome c-type biogenesis protein [Roseovarius sp. M141]